MTPQQFEALSDREQAAYLAPLAEAVVPVLAPWPEPHYVAGQCVESVKKWLGPGSTPEDVVFWIDHPVIDEGMNAQYSFVDDNPDALAALTVVELATGSAAYAAYVEAGRKGEMPQTAESATPDVTVEALARYDELAANGKVPTRQG